MIYPHQNNKEIYIIIFPPPALGFRLTVQQSVDFSPLDLYVCGHLETLLYSAAADNEDRHFTNWHWRQTLHKLTMKTYTSQTDNEDRHFTYWQWRQTLHILTMKTDNSQTDNEDRHFTNWQWRQTLHKLTMKTDTSQINNEDRHFTNWRWRQTLHKRIFYACKTASALLKWCHRLRSELCMCACFRWRKFWISVMNCDLTNSKNSRVIKFRTYVGNVLRHL